MTSAAFCLASFQVAPYPLLCSPSIVHMTANLWLLQRMRSYLGLPICPSWFRLCICETGDQLTWGFCGSSSWSFWGTKNSSSSWAWFLRSSISLWKLAKILSNSLKFFLNSRRAFSCLLFELVWQASPMAMESLQSVPEPLLLLGIKILDNPECQFSY